jgi:hypothetical protein
MLTRDRVAGVAILVFSVAVMWETRLLPLGSSISIIPEADKLFDRKPAYSKDQLTPIALISADPTKELGYDIEFSIWAGMFAPHGTPEPVVRKLRDTVRHAVQEPDFKGAMTKLETPFAYLDAPEFQKFWDKDAKMLADAIKRVGKIEEKK